MPRCKTHALTGISGAIKNMFGVVMGGMKASLHLKAVSATRFCKVLLDVYQIKIPDLHVMDAQTIMEGNGPTQGNLREYNKVLVSDNGVELDAIAATIMGYRPEDIDLLAYANEQKLGQINPEKIIVDGDLDQLPNVEKPAPYSLTMCERSKILKTVGTARPVWEAALCNECLTCIECCPTDAISITDNILNVEKKRCIICYCCTEVCPTQAMKVPDLKKLWRSLL